MLRNPLDNRRASAQRNCTNAQRNGFDFLDGTLGVADRQAFLTHLDTCAECRTEIAGMRAAERTLASATAPHVGDLRSGFYAKLAETQRRPQFTMWNTGMPALATCCAALLAVWLVRTSAVKTTAPTGAPSVAARTAALQASSPAEFAMNTESPMIFTRSAWRAETVRGLRNHDTPRIVVPSLHALTASLDADKGSRLASKSPATFMVQRSFGMPDAHGYGGPGNAGEGGPGEIAAKLGAPLAVNAQAADAEIITAPVAPDAGVSLAVHDDVRGFTATTEIAGLSDESDGRQVITIDDNPNGVAIPVMLPNG